MGLGQVFLYLRGVVEVEAAVRAEHGVGRPGGVRQALVVVQLGLRGEVLAAELTYESNLPRYP